MLVNLATCAIMSLSTAGVIKSLLKRQKIQRACLGTVFNLPMCKITLVEDLLMAGMSGAMIAAMIL